MTFSLLLTDATVYTQDDLNQIVREQLADMEFSQADSLRTAVEYSPYVMTPAEWVKACTANGVRENTARNRYSEVRRIQRQAGEI